MGILAQLLSLLTPIVMEEIKKWRADHNGEEPTSEQIQKALLDKNVALGEAEAAEWRRTHPRTP